VWNFNPEGKLKSFSPSLVLLSLVGLASTACDGTNSLFKPTTVDMGEAGGAAGGGSGGEAAGGTTGGTTGGSGGEAGGTQVPDAGPATDDTGVGGSIQKPDGQVGPPKDGGPTADVAVPSDDAAVVPPVDAAVLPPDGAVVLPPDANEPPPPPADAAVGPVPDAFIPPTPDAFIPPPPECLPGDTRFCAVPTCAGGTQTCDENGLFGPCVGPPEICDGLDNDCDGIQDEDFPNVGLACMVGTGACTATGTYICGAGGGVQCNAQPGTPQFELCDGADNDCNGTVDDDFDGSPLTADCYEGPDGSLGVGTCAAGVRVCGNGSFGECLGQVVPDLEVCNAEDDDCNGVADDGPGGAQLSETCYEGPAGTLDIGECRAGASVCIAGSLGACQQQVVPTIEICDELDNDCNGLVDDVAGGLSCVCNPGDSRACYTGPAGTEGVGACVAGVQSCTDRGLYGTCAGERVPENEACDGVDNDCDGQVDDALPGLDVACSSGLGECVRDGVTVCDSVAGAIVCNAVAAEPIPESCDGRDNDCDGQTDEELGLGVDCVVGIGVCVNRGVTVCGDNGNVVCGARPGNPVAELCDGLDNDCDGAVDNGLRLGEVCTLGTGACMAQGVFQCAADGSVACSAVPLAPTPEACDDIDNNCDGVVDDGNPGGGQLCDTGLPGVCTEGVRICVNGGFECRQTTQPGAERCDGIDNDCDGLADEDDQGDPLTRLCYDGPAGTQGVGLCHAGVQTCDAGLYRACVGQALPTPEICDFADNNCDGQADEGLQGTCVCAPGSQRECYTGPAGTMGVGACTAGSQTCAADGSGWGACGGEIFPGGETCNNIDDDCNGTVDDAPGVGLVCGEGVGACYREGHLVCNGDRGLLECDALGGQIIVEVCDGIDNDCDGNVDNVPGLGAACTEGVGSCERRGNNVCDLGARAMVCNVQAGQPVPELCDGADNDCNGTTDDGVPGIGIGCNEGTGACLANGVTECLGAAGVQCSANPGNPVRETCDGIDNNCDGTVDNNPTDVGQQCNVGVGACAAQGRFQCNNGVRACSAQPGQPQFEVCDQRDNDCDGQTDEGFACRTFSSCLSAFNAGARESGVYQIGIQNQFALIYCDMVSDGGGWTLVGSTRNGTLNDIGSQYYTDLRTLAPQGAHEGIFGILRAQNRPLHDVRFACRTAQGQQNTPFDVDMSFYGVGWYNEWTGSFRDDQVCFVENEGQGYSAQNDAVARRNNLLASFLPAGTQWNGQDQRGNRTTYLEGEDACNDTSDFSVDFRDRGMDSNEVDGTDWGEDDQLRKCGNRNDVDGQWFVFAREPSIFRPAAQAASFLVGAGPAFDAVGTNSVSCVEQCAALNGGVAQEYQCSTEANTINRQAWLDGFDDPQYCATPAADTFKVGGPYNCGAAGCSYSASVRNHDACLNKRNYCFRRAN
jgi:hypothetical protein